MLRIRSAHGCCSLPEDNPYENFKKFKNLIKDQQGNFNYEWDKRQVLWNAKGQIISECPYEIIVYPKIATKKFPRFLP